MIVAGISNMKGKYDREGDREQKEPMSEESHGI